ncbi:MAG: 2-hydroxyacyl-CoA dehydratase [Candidatus Helarchaeota archaeon]
MSPKAQMVEFLLTRNLLKFIIKYFSGTAQLRTAKRLKKPIISVVLPIGTELILAAKAMPIFLLRVGNYSSGTYLQAARTYKNIFGWNLLYQGINFLRPILGNNFFVKIVNQFLQNVYGTYETYSEVADNAGVPIDTCFGMRVYLGSTYSYINYLQGALGYGLRCNWLAKSFEEVAEQIPLILLEVPNSLNAITEEVIIDSCNQVIAQLEELTGHTITNEQIRKQIVLTNQIRSNYRKILKIWAEDSIPIAPLTFSYFLALLHIGNTDYMSDPQFFNQTLAQIVKDFRKYRGKGYDTTGMPKLLLVNEVGGYEPKLPEIIDEFGGRVLLADVEVFKMLEPIETSGDILKNYARFLMDFEASWMDNTTLVNRYITVAKEYHADGIIFNNMYGCKGITPSLRLFKENLHDSDLSLVDIGFQNIGDNLEQTKTRIGAILELIKERMA